MTRSMTPKQVAKRRNALAEMRRVVDSLPPNEPLRPTISEVIAEVELMEQRGQHDEADDLLGPLFDLVDLRCTIDELEIPEGKVLS